MAAGAFGTESGSRFNGGDPPEGWGGNRSFLTLMEWPKPCGWGAGKGRSPPPAPLPRGERTSPLGGARQWGGATSETRRRA
nr:hypothetical protein [Providencia sp. MGF014]